MKFLILSYSITTFFSLNAASEIPNSHVDKLNGVITFPILEHATVLERRRRELRRNLAEDGDNDVQLAGLYQGYGTHYIDLWIGSPEPQRQTVIVDTGSQITAFPCMECVDCGEQYHTDHYFDHDKSTTFRKLECDECKLGTCFSNAGQCTMGLSYQEGSSWKAYESVDVAYAGGLHETPVKGASSIPMGEDKNPNGLVGGMMPQGASDFTFNLHFGCQNKITGLFKTQLADGIMGMSNDKASFWEQMYEEGAIKKKIFSLCFRREQDSEKAGTSAGAMTLGGVQPLLHESPMVFAKNLRDHGFYTIKIRALYFRTNGGLVSWGDDDKIIKIDADESAINTGRIIVDSGTTDTYLNKRIMEPFLSTWKQVTGFDYRNDDLDLSEEQLDLLPTVLIQLYGDDVNALIAKDLNMKPKDIPGLAAAIDSNNPFDIVIAIEPLHYIEFDTDTNKYASRLYVDENSGGVLGANTMSGHDVMFDNENSRIGWAESSCGYHDLLEKKKTEEEEVDEVTPTETEKDSANTNEDENIDDDDTEILSVEEEAQSKPFIESSNGSCSSRWCRTATSLGLVLAVFQGILAWRWFRRSGQKSSRIPSEEKENVLDVFNDDDEEEEFAPDREIL